VFLPSRKKRRGPLSGGVVSEPIKNRMAFVVSWEGSEGNVLPGRGSRGDFLFEVAKKDICEKHEEKG